jgi:hypothetical protein
MNLRNELIRAVDALRNADVPYAICGGLAVVIHGYVRLTDDIDLLILPADIPKAKQALQSAGFGFSNPEPLVLPHGQADSLKIHRMLRMEGEEHLILDLIEANESLQSVWNTKQDYAWEGRSIHVVSREGLVHMKRKAGRPQDLADIANLQGGENHRHE